MIRTLLKFHNLDSTLDLNDQLSHFFKRGIVMGGDVLTVPAQLQVQVTPFKLIGFDGMVVIETSDTATLNVPAGQTSVVFFRSIYVPNNDPITGFDVLELSAYNAATDKDFLTVFAVVTVPALATQVSPTDIDYTSRDVIDPIGRMNVRGVLNNTSLLPLANNRAGDVYIVTSGLGDTPGIYVWNGVVWINTTDSLLVASLLAAHRSNLFSNEIHLTDEQAVAATGTVGTPGVEPITVAINIPTSTFTLANPLSNNDMALAEVVSFLTTGTLPSPLTPSTQYYAIPQAGPTGTTFKVATTPSNATANIPIVLGGSQSGTHTAVWKENKYVTSIDPRVPLQTENNALVGYPAAPIPSGSNPYVTSAYEIAAPSSKSISATAGPIAMLSGDGPFYVGFGGAGTAAQYFKPYHASLQREYVDPTSQVSIQITGVFKDAGLTQPLVPSSEPTVTGDFGFWTGPLYLAISSPFTANARILYEQKKLLSTIDRGSLAQPGPFSAETSQEVLQKFANVSGRVFDDPTPLAEQNKNLLIALLAVNRYIITTTAANLVVSNTEFARLRSYPQYAVEFAQQTNETVVVAGNQVFTVSNLTADVTAFDVTITTPDTPYVAVVTYSAPPVGLSGTQPGYIFTDGAGQRFRILNYNFASSPQSTTQILIYAGSRTVSTATSTTAGQIVAGNNPRQLELTYDHQTNFAEDFIEVSDLAVDPNDYEELPPGGGNVGVGAAFTLIGTNLLPNQGSGTGTGGRQAWQVLPKIQNNRFEQRVRLYGGWDSDQVNFPGQVIGNVSRGDCGIEFTGRLSDLALYTEFRSGAPFNYRVFVDGVYQEQLFASNLNEILVSGSSPVLSSAAYADYLTDRPKLQKVNLGLNLSTSQIHTVRVEITSSGSIPFALSGIGALYGSDLQEERGRTFIGASFIDTSTADDNLTPILVPRQATQKVIRYISESTGLRATATLSQPYYADPAYGHGNTAIVTLSGISDPLFPSVVGDVWYLSNRAAAAADTGSEIYLRVAGQSSGVRTLEAAPGFVPTYAELAYRVPSAPATSPSTGVPVLNAPISLFNKEQTRLLLTDWTVGRTQDVGALDALAQDTRTTVLADGSTALRMVNCTNQTVGLEGYLNALQLSQTNSEVQQTASCTRMDVVFCGTAGACTVTVTVDDNYSYFVSLSGTGVERHTLFFDGQLRSHSVKISAPTFANRVAIGEWVFHELADPAVVGQPIAEYNLLRNSNSSVTPFPAFAPLASTGISNNGIRLVDLLSHNARLYGATATINSSDANNEYFKTSFAMPPGSSDAGFTFEFFGSGFEIYMNATAIDAVRVNANGVALNTANFATANIPNGTLTGYTISVGLQRLVCTGLTPGFYKISLQNSAAALGTKTFYALGLLPMVGQVMRRNLDSTVPNDLHFNNFKDLRSFLSLLPEQIGLVSSENTGTAATTVAATSVQDLRPQPAYQAVVQDTFDVSATAPTSKVDATFTNASFNFGKQIYTMQFGSSSIATTGGSVSSVSLSAPLSSAATYTVKVNDLVYFQTLATWRRITGVTNQQQFTVDQPYNSTGEAVQVSQAVFTKDLVNLGDALEKNRLRDIFPGASITNVVIDYKDSVLLNDNNPDLPDPANVVVSASNSGLQSTVGLPVSTDFSSIYARPAAPNFIPQYPLSVNTNQQRLFLVFFPNPLAPPVASPNLIQYTVSAYPQAAFLTSYNNAARLGFLADLWVGTPTDVAQGYAQYSSLQAAVNFAAAGNKIRIRGNVTITESVTISTPQLSLEGNGYSSNITGTITLSSTCNYSTIRSIRCSQFIINAGATKNILTNDFYTTAPSDSGTGTVTDGNTTVP